MNANKRRKKQKMLADVAEYVGLKWETATGSQRRQIKRHYREGVKVFHDPPPLAPERLAEFEELKRKHGYG